MHEIDAADEQLIEKIAARVIAHLRGTTLPPQEYFSIDQAAAMLGISPRTLRTKHEKGEGPRATHVPGGKLVRFHRDAISDWFAGEQRKKRR